MGIPTFVEFSSGYLDFLKENPFIACNINNLKERLLQLIDNEQLRRAKINEGRAWAEKYHSYRSVNDKLDLLYYDNKII